MEDSVSQTSHQSWGSRIVSSLTGVVVGLILIGISIALLFWNEANSLGTSKSLKEGAAIVIDIEPEPLNPSNDGRLVHVTGNAVTKEGVADSTFAISAPALRLRRSVEMYQWTENKSEEEKKNLGGSTDTVTTYTYEKKWTADTVDSSKFNQSAGHENPRSMIAEGETFTAGDVTLGAFAVPKRIVDDMPGDVPLKPTQAQLDKLSEDLGKNARLADGGYYFGVNPEQPAVGDQRVTFKVLEPGTFSIIAQQTRNTFQPYVAKAGKEIERVEAGSVTAPLMFKHAQDENAMFTWLLRLGGFLMMWIGLAMIFKPLSVLADVIPFLGGIVGAGGALVSLLIAVVGTFVTIAIAWLAVRPLLGATLLVAAGAVLTVAIRAMFRRRATAS